MRSRGSITIFAALALAVIMSLIFTLLESARLYGLQAHVELEGRLLLESAMAQYHMELYERYHLYFLEANAQGDLSFTSLEEDMKTLGNENLSGKVSGVQEAYTNLYGLELTDCFVTGYELATDFSGEAYRRQAADHMQRMIGVIAWEEWNEKAQQTEELMQQEEELEEKWNRADEAQSGTGGSEGIMSTVSSNCNRNNSLVSHAGRIGIMPVVQKAVMQEAAVPESESTAETDTSWSIDNPMEVVNEWKNKGVLAQVADVSAVSDRTLQGDSLSERELYEGSYDQSSSNAGMAEDAWFREYLLREFGCYREPEEQGALSYAQEYFIAGKSSDMENLTAVVERLLLVREVANYLYMRQDPKKSAAAYSTAQAISILLLQPELAEVIKEGILIAWAYMESVSDVRTLLEGGKVPLLKNSGGTASDYAATSSVSASGAESNGGQESAGSGEQGLSYEDYLRIFLYLTGKDKLAMRSLNLMEKSMRLIEGQEQFSMDCMVMDMEISCWYEAQPLFFGWFGSGEGWKGSYVFAPNQRFAYQ